MIFVPKEREFNSVFTLLYMKQLLISSASISDNVKIINISILALWRVKAGKKLNPVIKITLNSLHFDMKTIATVQTVRKLLQF